MLVRFFALLIVVLLGFSGYLFWEGQQTRHLNDIETAAFSSSLSKFDDYMKTFKDKHSQDVRWVTLKTAELQAQCQEEVKVTPLPRTIMEDVRFKGSQKTPFSGAWVQSYRLENCGKQKQINILYRVYEGEAPDSRLILDGTTLADVVTQSDGIKHATRATQVKFMGCANWSVRDTEFLGAEIGGRDGAWQEKWELNGCGATFDVLMSFYPTQGFSTQVKAEVQGKKL